MKKFLVYAALFCGIGSALPALADQGVKTIIKGDALEASQVNVWIKGGMPTLLAKAAVSNGHFVMEADLTKPGFFDVMISDPRFKGGFDVFLNPGDNLSLSVKENKLVFSGNGGQVNQFYFDLTHKYDYTNSQYTLKQVYTNRVNEINASTNAEVVRNRVALLGYTQGEYLDKVFGSYMDSKIGGETDAINKVKFDDLNLQLFPGIVYYNNWNRTISELMFAKMEAGKLNVRSINTWVADFAKEVENQKLREDYIVALLDHAALEGDVFTIKQEAKEAMPLVKDPASVSKINAALAKAEKNTTFNNALPGTDMSAFTFVRPDGSTAAISDYKGKYIFMDLWSTSCHPCIAEIPFLKKLEHEMQGENIVFVSLSGDNDAGLWKNFLTKRNLSGEQILMKEGMRKNPFFNQVGLTGIPRFLIIDKEGKMVNAKCCQRPSNPLLKIYLKELLSKKS
ncbi:TlpA family protein disulfide reductase [Solitalea koreensis]|uniref:Thiol-disulfide isomerase or thioredoxin n=1 Tax=Solitalea koreensis TaxID=543615 RepID=A0A521CA46_9SPHI|nr:TlpA disulfide reductase family protein [Solitalea koreensis]SMO56329.1 Thiol-disulfide isomerase or thioredoxin [Solitalea koreensis]